MVRKRKLGCTSAALDTKNFRSSYIMHILKNGNWVPIRCKEATKFEAEASSHTAMQKGYRILVVYVCYWELYCGFPWAIVGLRVSSACSGADYQLCKSKLGKSSNPQATTTRTSLLCTVSISYLSKSQSLSLRVSWQTTKQLTLPTFSYDASYEA